MSSEGADVLLQWIGSDEYNARLARVRAFWGGSERFLVSVHSPENIYRQTFDHATILELAPLHLKAQVPLPGVNLPSFYPDFGTISTAKYWGGRSRFDSTGDHIFVDPAADSTEEALAIEPLPIDHPDMDAVPAVQLYESLCEQLKTESLWFRPPDLQGPLNTAGLVIKQDNFLTEMYIAPEAVHEFLARVTDLLIRYVRYFREKTHDRICGSIWPHTFFPCDLGVVAFTEDLMPLLSAELYQEFGVPCLEKLSGAFGGLQIHCCGDWGRHAPALRQSQARIMAVEFHYPFTKMEELECLAPDTVFVPYISLDKQDDYASVIDYYEDLLACTDHTHRFWFAFAEDTPDAIAFAERHGF